MKILVFSDSHGMTSDMEKAVNTHTADKIIFLGDCVEDAEKIKMYYPSKTVMIVKGNNDLWSYYPDRIITEEEGCRIFCTHGHRERVKSGLTTLDFAAQSERCTVALFGHTHRQFAETLGGVLFLNPGSVGMYGNYALLSLKNGAEPEYKLY